MENITTTAYRLLNACVTLMDDSANWIDYANALNFVENCQSHADTDISFYADRFMDCKEKIDSALYRFLTDSEGCLVRIEQRENIDIPTVEKLMRKQRRLVTCLGMDIKEGIF